MQKIIENGGCRNKHSKKLAKSPRWWTLKVNFHHRHHWANRYSFLWDINLHHNWNSLYLWKNYLIKAFKVNTEITAKRNKFCCYFKNVKVICESGTLCKLEIKLKNQNRNMMYDKRLVESKMWKDISFCSFS